MDDDQEEVTEVGCTCTHCDETTFTPDEGAWVRGDDDEWYCGDGCREYSVTPGGDVRCDIHGGGLGRDTCEDCAARIEWGVIYVGGPGVHNYHTGVCKCPGREWYEHERRGGLWDTPTYTTIGRLAR